MTPAPDLINRAIDDILAQFTCGEQVAYILPTLRRSVLQSYRLYRSHLRSDISERESSYRTAVDEVMEMCSLISIASNDLGAALIAHRAPYAEIAEILDHPAIIRYSTVHYPMAYAVLARADFSATLPQALQTQLTAEGKMPGWEQSLSNFLSLNAQLLSDALLLDFLFLLDGHYVADTLISELQDAFGSPAAMAEWLEPDGRAALLEGMERLLDFCEALHELLAEMSAFPMLRGRIWLHYSYWLGYGGPHLRETTTWLVKALETLNCEVVGNFDPVESLQTIFRDLTDPFRFAGEVIYLADPLLSVLPGLRPSPVR